MKDKHIHIDNDSRMLRLIYDTVEKNLTIDGSSTASALIRKFLFYFSWLIFFYGLIHITGSFTMIVLAYILYGLAAVLLGFNFAHDFCHNTVLKNKSLNNLGFTAIYTLLGAHAEAWKHRHIHSHHYAPNVKHYDSDLQITGLIRVEPTAAHRWFHRFQHYYAPLAYMTYSLYWIFIKDFVIYFKGFSGSSPGYHLSFWIQKLVYFSYLVVLPALLTDFSLLQIALAFTAMHLVQSLFLLLTFFISHHVERTEYFSADENGYIQTSWILNQIKSSNDFHPFSPTANFIFGGFNNHIAHHLFPHIHHIHYPRLNKILYRILLQNDIRPNVTSFFGGVFSHLKHLKNLSQHI